MNRKWTPNGITTAVPFQPLSESAKGQILSSIKRKNLELNTPEDFWDDINTAISAYHSSRKIGEESSPSIVREKLDSVLALTLKLNDEIQKLDHNSKNLIAEAEDELGEKLQQAVTNAVKIIGKADFFAKEYPKRGRLTEYHKLNLASYIGDAIEKHFGKKPTATENGLFDEILSIVLGDITGTEGVSARGIIQQTLKWIPRN